jgi:hypothetical protein
MCRAHGDRRAGARPRRCFSLCEKQIAHFVGDDSLRHGWRRATSLVNEGGKFAVLRGT